MKRGKKWAIPEIYAKIPMSDAVRRFLEDCERNDERTRIRDCRYLIRQQLSDMHLVHLMNPIQSVGEQVEERVLIEQVLTALGRLSEYEQFLIRKRFYEGWNLHAIASEISIHPSTVKRQVDRILKKLSDGVRE